MKVGGISTMSELLPVTQSTEASRAWQVMSVYVYHWLQSAPGQLTLPRRRVELPDS